MYKFILVFLLLGCAAFTVNAQDPGTGKGTGMGIGNKTDKDEKNTPLRILSKPRAIYTETAKAKKIEGKVTLQVEFKKDGKIGKISIVSSLPEGLSEQAVKAAEQMGFEPQKKDGKPVTVTKTITYGFSLF